MKEFIGIVGFALLLTFTVFAGLYYTIEVMPCNTYAEMVNLEHRHTGNACYVRRDGVWIERFYNDRFEMSELEEK